MDSLDQQYNEILRAARTQSAAEKEAEAVSGVFPAVGTKWSLHTTQFDERPYVRAACAQCKTVFTTGDLSFVFRHCGEEELMPLDLKKRLEALQIKKGIRMQTGFDKIRGISRPAPAPAPALNHF